jgi:uncharacterized protein
MVFTPDQLTALEPALSLKREHLLKQKYPKKHHHYCVEDFFAFDTKHGSITDWNECRNTLTTEDFIIGLIEGLEAEVGSASGVVLFLSDLVLSRIRVPRRTA